MSGDFRWVTQRTLLYAGDKYMGEIVAKGELEKPEEIFYVVSLPGRLMNERFETFDEAKGALIIETRFR